MPRVITGLLSAQNKNAIDWGWSGFVAFGAQSFVVVAHPGRVEWIQTLEGHSSSVTKVRWSRENYPHEMRSFNARKDSTAKSAARLRLASADSSGQIIIWDVLKGIQMCTFTEQNKPVGEMFWLPWQDASNDLLLALHYPNNVILWNADQATKIWKKSYNDNLTTFSLDPFQFSNAAFLTQLGNLMLMDDLSFSKTPSGSGQQFKVSPSACTSVSIDEVDAKRASLATVFIKRPLIKVLATAGGKILENAENLSVSTSSNPTSPMAVSSNITDENWAQVCYHPSVRNVLFLVYPREIVVLDSQTVQTIIQIVFEKSASPLLQIIPCWLRDAVYFIQENGTISFRLQKYKSSAQRANSNDTELDVFNPLDVVYELVCSSESLRITKTNRTFGVALCPVTQRKLVLLLSSGKLLTYELVPPNEFSSLTVLSDMIRVDSNLRQESISKMRFTNCGSLSSLNGGPLVIRACPTPSGPEKQTAAIGTSDGFIVLIDIRNGSIEKDLAVHSCSVKCLEWVGANHLISAAYTQTLSTCAVVRNELFLTDVRTGLSKVIRPECDESPIELLRVSHFCSFLAVAFRDQPLEIWDLKAFRLLRRMAKTCPVIVDIAWSTKHNQTQTAAIDEKSAEGESEISEKKISGNPHTVYRENLVVLDDENHLYHVVVKGIHVRDGKEVNTQRAGGGTITAMAWKEEILLFGYADGHLSVWNLEAKQSKASLAQRGVVKRLQFSKQPTDLTFLVLHSDGVAIWNALKFICLYQLNSFKEIHNRVLDVDLAGEDNVPLIITADGCLRVFDSTLTKLSQNVEDSGSPVVFSSSSVPQSIISLTKVILLDRNVINCYNSLDYELVSSQKSELMKASSPDDFFSAIQKMDADEQDKLTLSRHLAVMEENIFKDIASLSNPERALALSRLFGDEWDVNFWTLVSGVIRENSPDLIPTNFDLFWDNENFYKLQMRRCSIFDCKRCTNEQLHSQVESLILLGKFESAAQVLLDTESGRVDYYTDCLKACLLASSHTSAGCQSTMKLTATNLIADGKISEGVELLRIIDKTLDACRYLQSFSCWEKAAWLAKVALKEGECKEILRRWVDALCGPQLSKKTFAVLLLLSLRQYDRLFELLLSMRQICTAALFLDCISSISTDVKLSMDKNLTETIYVEYARFLFGLGLKKAAFTYCGKAGDRGINIAKELEILYLDDN